MQTRTPFSRRPYLQPPALVYQVWLGGGQLAYHAHQTIEVLHSAGLGATAFASAQLPRPNTLFQALAACGLPIIGVTALQTQDEIDGRGVPWFMAWTDHEYWWGAKNSSQRWQMIAYGAEKAELQNLHDLADRIAIALDDSQARLRDLCAAYASQLAATLPEDLGRALRCFSDAYSQRVYLHIHGLFWQMATLRDLLATYAAEHVFHLADVSSFAVLIRAIRRIEDPRPPVAEVFLRAAEAGGWIAVFTAYRNLFTHSAPLQSAQGTHRTWQDTRLLYGRAVPQLYYPLPLDPESLVRTKSSRGSPLTMPQPSSDPPVRSIEPDALDYLAGVLNRFVYLADILASTSPVQPELPILTDDDILDFKIRNE